MYHESRDVSRVCGEVTIQPTAITIGIFLNLAEFCVDHLKGFGFTGGQNRRSPTGRCYDFQHNCKRHRSTMWFKRLQ